MSRRRTELSGMSSLRIAAAQSVSLPGNISANLDTHCAFIRAASVAAVDLLLFPELSLTGYELDSLGSCALKVDDGVLAPVRELACSKSMTVIVGAPLENRTPRPYIAAFIFFPDGRMDVYCKTHLHSGEQAFATAGEGVARCHALNGELFSLAICADTAHEVHAKRAATAGASLYLASVLVSESGYSADAGLMNSYAARCGFAVLMANHGGPSGGYVSAGKSAVWAPGGELIIAAAGSGSQLVIAQKTERMWSGELIKISA